MYKITATIEKEGGTPTNWTRYSKSKLTKSECEKMLSVDWPPESPDNQYHLNK
ncbi:DUF1187 family protein [Escherichia coli]|nr:DUF1187 family protein [Escherichia coli]